MAKFITKDADGFERIVYAEVVIPDSLNVFGDYHTKEAIRQFAYGFMMNGFGIDIDHDNDDVSQDVYVVESFIARPGDPDFIEGAWVVGMHIASDEIWQKVLDGEINGYSYEALMRGLDIQIEVPYEVTRNGVTEPDLRDGHTHEFFVILDPDGRVIVGGTTETDGHTHKISQHTFTDDADGHSHIFNFVIGSGGL